MQRYARRCTPGAPSQCQSMLGNPPSGFTPKVGPSGQTRLHEPDGAVGHSSTEVAALPRGPAKTGVLRGEEACSQGKACKVNLGFACCYREGTYSGDC